MQNSGQFALLILTLASVVALGCSPPPETDATDYYAGKTLRIIVPFGSGGSFDRHARLLAQCLGDYLPGQPTVFVENMPGAGGLVAARYMVHQARPDGLTLGMFSSSLFCGSNWIEIRRQVRSRST